MAESLTSSKLSSLINRRRRCFPANLFLQKLRSDDVIRSGLNSFSSVLRHDSFLISSWDGTVKLWTLDCPTSLRTFKEHSYCVYSAVWNPLHAGVFASASGDCTLRIWDVREPSSTMVLAPHEFEVPACDWNKYDDCIVATASVDNRLRFGM